MSTLGDDEKVHEDVVRSVGTERSDTDGQDKDVKLSLGSIRRIMYREGVTKISADALVEVRNVLDDILVDLSRKVVVYTKHRSAKVSTKDDILLALR